MGACTVKVSSAGRAYDPSCIAVERTLTTTQAGGAPETSSEDFRRFAYVNLTDDHDGTAPWHTGGQLSVTYDNWTGTLRYSDGQTPPSYKLAPAAGVAIDGVLIAN